MSQTGILWLFLAFAVSNAFVMGPPARYANEAGDDVVEEEPLNHHQTPFDFDDIWKLRPASFMGRWYGEQLSYLTKSADVILRDENGTETTVVKGNVLRENNINQFYFSPDMDQILMAYDKIKVWRHSWTAKYRVLRITDNKTVDVAGGDRLQYCRWGSVGHSLAYTKGNNFYYLGDAFFPATEVQITNDGDLIKVFNGIPDWMYEEDVLGSSRGHYFSPDGGFIIFAKFDDINVPLIRFKKYGDKSDVYGQIEEIAYPKAGDLRNDQPGPITMATLHILSTNNAASTVKINPPSELANVDHYYTRVAWLSENLVLITWTNRTSNMAVVQACSISLKQNKPVPDCFNHFTHSVSNGWIDSPWPKAVPVSEDGTQYVIPHSKDEGKTGTWKHAALFDVKVRSKSESTPHFLTGGLKEVMLIIAYNKQRDEIYYLGTGGNPIDRHLYRMNMTLGANMTDRIEECMSCSQGSGCQYVAARFSASASSYIQTCYGPDVPTYSVRSTSNDSDGMHYPANTDQVLPMIPTLTSFVPVWHAETNKEFKDAIAKKLMPERQFMKVKVGGGYETWAEIFKPANFDENKKYPLLIFVYGGPGSQRVMKTYPLGSKIRNWLNYLKSSHQVVVASVDGRGAKARGDKYKFELFRRQGTVEVQDQIKIARELKAKMNFIDKDKETAIFGWSYGGQTSSHALADGGKDIGCAIAVAPSTSKMYYDSAFTERFMGLATSWDNADGYNRTEVMNKAHKFHGKKYLIAHGTADDNVHFLQAAHMINALVKEEVQFRQLMYVDEDHSINSPHHARHLFAALTNFLIDDCWQGNKPAPTTPAPSTPKPSGARGLRMSSLNVLLVTAMMFVFRQIGL